MKLLAELAQLRRRLFDPVLCRKISKAEFEDSRRQREFAPVLHDIAELGERAQNAPRGGARKPGRFRRLRQRHRRPLLVERAEQRQTFGERGHELFVLLLFPRGAFGVSFLGISCAMAPAYPSRCPPKSRRQLTGIRRSVTIIQSANLRSIIEHSRAARHSASRSRSGVKRQWHGQIQACRSVQGGRHGEHKHGEQIHSEDIKQHSRKPAQLHEGVGGNRRSAGRRLGIRAGGSRRQDFQDRLCQSADRPAGRVCRSRQFRHLQFPRTR